MSEVDLFVLDGPIGLHGCIKIAFFARFDDGGLQSGDLEVFIVLLPLRKRLLRLGFVRAILRVFFATAPSDFESSRSSISLRRSRAEGRSRIASKAEASQPYSVSLELELSPR